MNVRRMRISPLILLVLIVLAVMLMVYGVVHLVLRLLMKRTSSSSSLYNSNRLEESLERQLQQLFRLHDSGLDQTLIDALPLFYYHDLLGSKEPFDCAVCLSDFSHHDKLRLLPLCTHAFHINCLDTWLLSHSSCPLCRASLSNYVNNHNHNHNHNSLLLPNTSQDSSVSQRVFSVRLGKFTNTAQEGDATCSLNERRCYSMGSYRYVLPDSNLQVLLPQSHHVNVEGKRIGDSTKVESFSVSKIWLWSKNTTFHASNIAPFP